MAPSADALDDGRPWADEPPSPNGYRQDSARAPATADPETPGGIESRILPGGCILDEPETPPALWGDGDAILWAEGESLIIAGPDGTGKTTLAGCITRARLGIGDGLVLGMPVEPGKRNVLYLAMDRPRQARRALRRLFTTADRDDLDGRLRIWQGPPPVDLARGPGMLAELARLADADTIIVDSLKDAALKLSDDEAGSGWNRARQMAIEAGAELIELHHPRKAQSDNRKPSKLEDLYGSRWITSGAGSVICLWGDAGDLVVELTHLKAPAAQAGPWQVGINPAAGTVHLEHPAVDLVEQVRLRAGHGMTADVAARLIFECEPTASQVKKAAYRLDKKVTEGILYRRPGQRGGGSDRAMTTWFLAAADPESNPEPGAGEQSEKQSEPMRKPPAPGQSETGGDTSPRFRDCPPDTETS
jgi:AAA domain